jgi:hypothetical protein
MKKIVLLIIVSILIISCNKNDDSNNSAVTPTNYGVDFRFTQNWDGQEINNSDYENTTYVNANGESLTLSKLNYLISDVTFTPAIEIPEGTYTVSFTFGFDDFDNDKQGGFPDLNSADGFWNVPAPLGGGYHYQRIEGKYINSASDQTNFQFHTIRANRHETLPPGPGTLVELRDTSFRINLGNITAGTNTTIEVKANIAEWFKNPVTWNLNNRFQVLMPNFQAQLDMNLNGQNVFELGAVTQ